MPRTTEIFGELVFNKRIMRNNLSQDAFKKFMSAIDSGTAMDETLAADVAHAMKDWAITHGATHFTHWFQPQRGGTAEKHDAFIDYDSSGEIIESFSAKQLIQSEPDASSFPSGGIRSTFEARGYTAWDPTSPAFLLENGKTKTLVIPSVYLSWTGDVLDMKRPFLKSLRALNDAAIRLQRTLGNRLAKKVIVNAGPEQEYFVVAKRLYDKRPDLHICGRTLFGAPPAKGQQMEDHYFGSINSKMIRFMEALDNELYRRGIPAKTRHNEVSPNQFEIAPLYESANLAIDHNLQMMDILTNVAERFDMVILLHEKPYAKVNGSGKHLNWSISDNTGANYLEPSASPLKNISFLLTVGALLLGVKDFGGLLRASAADAGNDHRLGANEAPPAIMSVYLGEYLTKLFDEIEGIRKLTDSDIAHITMGVRNLPRVARDHSDRNRTSPLAFTGNKFEFRAAGSSQNPSESLTILNLLVTYGYHNIHQRIIARKSNQEIKEQAILVLRDIIKETRHVRFEGNNYSDDWHKEAKKRGLPNFRNTPAALPVWQDPEVVELLQRSYVLTKREIDAKVEIKLETYIKTREIELKTAENMVQTLVLPALTRQITQTATAAFSLKQAGLKPKLLTEQAQLLSDLYDNLVTLTRNLSATLKKADKLKDLTKKAHFFGNQGDKALQQLREKVDQAEELVDDSLWPLAKYQDLLTRL